MDLLPSQGRSGLKVFKTSSFSVFQCDILIIMSSLYMYKLCLCLIVYMYHVCYRWPLVNKYICTSESPSENKVITCTIIIIII